MTPLEIAIVSLVAVLMIAASVVSYRRNRRVIEKFEIFETFEGDEQTQLKLPLSAWMVPRVDKRLRRLGWNLVDSKAARDCTIALFEKSNAPDAQPLSVVLHHLNRSGFLGDLSNSQEQTNPDAQTY